jgi:tRNA pseudouridine38-40 synthase
MDTLHHTTQALRLKDTHTRFVLEIEYCGAMFFGWQRQDGFQTVQASIEDALLQVIGNKNRDCLNNKRIIVHGSGRTDTGVHALKQIAHIEIPKTIDFDPDKIQYGLNYYLQDSGTCIVKIGIAPFDFHARFSAIKRAYRYTILNRRAPSVLLLERAWHVRHELDLEKMTDAANLLIGTHDFTSFRDTDCQAKSPIRTIESIDIIKTDDLIHIDLAAKSFLHHQVRIMIGTLQKIGSGRYPPSTIVNILDAKKRSAAGPTAPAFGLYFKNVIYPDSITPDILK